jgi:hypothetical protein
MDATSSGFGIAIIHDVVKDDQGLPFILFTRVWKEVPTVLNSDFDTQTQTFPKNCNALIEYQIFFEERQDFIRFAQPQAARIC